jgi:hypothetical protein
VDPPKHFAEEIIIKPCRRGAYRFIPWCNEVTLSVLKNPGVGPELLCKQVRSYQIEIIGAKMNLTPPFFITRLVPPNRKALGQGEKENLVQAPPNHSQPCHLMILTHDRGP